LENKFSCLRYSTLLVWKTRVTATKLTKKLRSWHCSATGDHRINRSALVFCSYLPGINSFFSMVMRQVFWHSRNSFLHDWFGFLRCSGCHACRCKNATQKVCKKVEGGKQCSVKIVFASIVRKRVQLLTNWLISLQK
jgi:hypothetical protein